MSPHLRAILQALAVTFLWATSFPLIKIGLRELPPLTFAGARYALASVVLWLTTFGRAWAGRRKVASGDGAREVAGEGVGWATLVLLGVLGFSIPQAAQFAGLRYLPTTDVSLLFNFIAVATALLSAWVVREPPAPGQVSGIVVALGEQPTLFQAGCLVVVALATAWVQLSGRTNER